jgi:predicted HD phosphohydrolase
MDESRKNQGHLLAQQQALAEMVMAADALLSAALKHDILA